MQTTSRTTSRQGSRWAGRRAERREGKQGGGQAVKQPVGRLVPTSTIVYVLPSMLSISGCHLRVAFLCCTVFVQFVNSSPLEGFVKLKGCVHPIRIIRFVIIMFVPRVCIICHNIVAI